MTTKYKVFVAKRVTKTPELGINDGIFILKSQYILKDGKKTGDHLSSPGKRRDVLYIIKPFGNEIRDMGAIEIIWIQ